MNVSAALMMQSILFSGLVLAKRGGVQDPFAVLYVVGVGLLMSSIVWSNGYAGLDPAISALADLD